MRTIEITVAVALATRRNPRLSSAPGCASHRRILNSPKVLVHIVAGGFQHHAPGRRAAPPAEPTYATAGRMQPSRSPDAHRAHPDERKPHERPAPTIETAVGRPRSPPGTPPIPWPTEETAAELGADCADQRRTLNSPRVLVHIVAGGFQHHVPGRRRLRPPRRRTPQQAGCNQRDRPGRSRSPG